MKIFLPPFLYKIVAEEKWSDECLQLTEEDFPFIHLAEHDQLERILDKYWQKIPCVILKLDTAKLPGRLVYEANPGGSNKYYHLYDGSIPHSAVVGVFTDKDLFK